MGHRDINVKDFSGWRDTWPFCFYFQMMGAGAFVAQVTCILAAGSPHCWGVGGEGGAAARPAPAPPSPPCSFCFSDSWATRVSNVWWRVPASPAGHTRRQVWKPWELAGILVCACGLHLVLVHPRFIPSSLSNCLTSSRHTLASGTKPTTLQRLVYPALTYREDPYFVCVYVSYIRTYIHTFRGGSTSLVELWLITVRDVKKEVVSRNDSLGKCGSHSVNNCWAPVVCLCLIQRT